MKAQTKGIMQLDNRSRNVQLFHANVQVKIGTFSPIYHLPTEKSI